VYSTKLNVPFVRLAKIELGKLVLEKNTEGSAIGDGLFTFQ
jgi:hypothetical protein